jgi:hypothetical protein
MSSTSTSLQGTPLFRDHHDMSPFLMSSNVLFTLVLYAVVFCLRDADKLTIVTARSHHTSMVKFVHGGEDPEAVSDLQLLCLATHMFHLNLTIDEY